MRLVKEIKGDVALLTLKGEFDAFVCNPFMQQMQSLLDIDIRDAILNMRLVQFINSTGLGSVIKCHRKFEERDGELVISSPGQFVTEVMQHLGIRDIFKIFDNDEDALAHFNVPEGIEMSESNNILVHPVGESGSAVVGRIHKLEEDKLVFETHERESKMAVGSDIRLKFRLPLFRKSHYFDITAKITEMVHSSTGITITTQFTHIFEEDRKSIGQFVRDMQFLRKEARGT